jgi:hypothetical protein
MVSPELRKPAWEQKAALPQDTPGRNKACTRLPGPEGLQILSATWIAFSMDIKLK